jgi:hypothetical protein
VEFLFPIIVICDVLFPVYFTASATVCLQSWLTVQMVMAL